MMINEAASLLRVQVTELLVVLSSVHHSWSHIAYFWTVSFRLLGA